MKVKLLAIAMACTLSLATASCYATESVKKPKKVYHVCSKSDTARDVLACNIYKESRGEGVKGMMAVGLVTLNRLEHSSFPTSIRKVVYQKKQFSWANTEKNVKITHKDSWKDAKMVASFLLSIKDNTFIYEKVDFTDGSTYFHTKSVKPIWRHQLVHTVDVGNHTFYKTKES